MPVIYAAVVIIWGIFFFMGIPAAFGLLASRSQFPEERAGDAQAVMALGRVFGPLLGGAFIAADRTTAMGVAAFAIMGSAATLMLYVDRDRLVQTRRRMRSEPAVDTSSNRPDSIAGR